MAKKNDKTMHIILKYNNTVYDVDTIKEHSNVIENSGKVIWGIIKPSENSPGVGKAKSAKIKEQLKEKNETYAYFVSKGKVKAKGRIIDILTNEEVKNEKSIVPEYYHEALDRCVAGIKLESLVDEDKEVINELERFGTKDGSIAVGNQTNPLYVSFKDGKKAKSIEVQDITVLPENEVKDYINNVTAYFSSMGYHFTKEDISNFYLSLKIKPFVILAGISGTGKSKMSRLFAEAMGANSSNGRFHIISVKPDWNDSSELFGYKSITGEFVVGSLTRIVKDAIENPTLPYVVCIDEMNLARVEYYLSEYLSIIESRYWDGTKVMTDKIFHDPEYCGDHYINLYIPQNLYIVGAVNMDDTTFGFSRKVLDRGNAIEFSNVEFSKIFSEKEYEDESVNLTIHNEFLQSNYLNIQEIEEEHRDFAKRINDKIETVNELLKTGNRHFAYRVRDEMIFYMLENRKLKLLKEEEAFDYQIMQKILPTLNGSQVIVRDILVDLYNYCLGKTGISTDGDYLSDAEKSLKDAIYPKSASKIIDMLRGYQYDGFSTFWT